MGSSVLYMSISVDGFITGPNVRPDNGLGDEGQHLHDWAFPGAEGGDFEAAQTRLKGANKQIWDETMATGAVIAGRHTFEPAGGWNGDHHDGVQVYILSRHEAPGWVRKWSNVHYVDDLGYAMRAAKAAAGERNVMVHGGSTLVPMALRAGLLDEMELHTVPFLLGAGTRLFDGLGFGLRHLERVRVLEGDGGVTHTHYRVRK